MDREGSANEKAPRQARGRPLRAFIARSLFVVGVGLSLFELPSRASAQTEPPVPTVSGISPGHRLFTYSQENPTLTLDELRKIAADQQAGNEGNSHREDSKKDKARCPDDCEQGSKQPVTPKLPPEIKPPAPGEPGIH